MLLYLHYLRFLIYYVLAIKPLRGITVHALTVWYLQQHTEYAVVDSIQKIVYLLFVLASISIFLFLGGLYLSKTHILRRIALTDVQSTKQGYTSPTYSSKLIGAQGIAQTPLRPSGKVTIRGMHYDAKTLGAYIPSETHIIVISVSGSSLTVATT